MELMTDQSNTWANIQIGKPMSFYCNYYQEQGWGVTYMDQITQRQLYQQKAHPNVCDSSLRLQSWSSLQFADRSTIPTSHFLQVGCSESPLQQLFSPFSSVGSGGGVRESSKLSSQICDICVPLIYPTPAPDPPSSWDKCLNFERVLWLGGTCNTRTLSSWYQNLVSISEISVFPKLASCLTG